MPVHSQPETPSKVYQTALASAELYAASRAKDEKVRREVRQQAIHCCSGVASQHQGKGTRRTAQCAVWPIRPGQFGLRRTADTTKPTLPPSLGSSARLTPPPGHHPASYRANTVECEADKQQQPTR